MTDRAISPLRRRLIEDMTVRGFTPATQQGYLRTVADFTAFFGHPPDRAGAEDLRRYQVHMRSQGASATTMNAAVSALRFFFGVTLGRKDAQTGMTTVREPRRLSVILILEEVARLLDAAPDLKAKAAMSVSYGAACPTPADRGAAFTRQRQASDNPSHKLTSGADRFEVN